MKRFQRYWAVFVLLVLAISGLGIMGCTQVKQQQTTNDPWDQLFSQYWHFQMERNPLWATYLGDHRFDDRLPDPSEGARLLEYQTLQNFLRRALELVQRDSVAAGDSLNVQLFVRELEIELEDFKWHDEYMPITPQSGPQIELPEMVNFHPFETMKDVENYITRLKETRHYIHRIIANMNLGIQNELVAARVTIEKALPQVAGHVVADAEKSVFAEPIAKLGAAIPEAERRRLRAEILDAIRNDIFYSFDLLATYLNAQYLPACRDTVGWLALPDGRERYANRVRRYTTTDLTPQQVFDTGMKELEWIRAEMEKIKDSVGFRGNLRAFIEYLKTDPQFHFTSADSLVDGFKRIMAEMDSKMPLLFGRLPKTPYSYREIEPYRAASAPDAYYYPPPEDGSRPGYFYINTYKPEQRPKYTMQALAFHEAVPGHHLQIALQQELTNLPAFRRHGGYTAFIEGWGLYSERLPKEVGFYNDPYSEFGRLTFEAWRACRLVVDPGIHHLGWTRQQAIDFMRENTGLSDLNIESEVDRYIAWPGQATAYKIGQLKILELRARTQETLGPRFDRCTFHDALLSDGALPLDLLEQKMARWIEAIPKD